MAIGSRAAGRWIRLVALALAVALAIGVGLVGIAWLGAVPWWVWRGAKFAFLYALRLGYAIVFVAAPIATLVLGERLVRARRRREARPALARVLLMCASACTGLVLVEAAAAAWWALAQRAPALPRTFASEPRLPQFAGAEDGNRFDVRIAVLGGSSAFGTPYDGYTSIGHIVAWQLAQAIPFLKIQIDMLAAPGSHLEHEHKKLAKLDHHPDAMIVYSGHNEFYSRDPVTRAAVRYADQTPGYGRHALVRLARRTSAVFRLIDQTIDLHLLALRPPAEVELHRSLVDVPSFSPGEYAERLADFRRRLEAIVAYCEAIDCLPILVIPAANDGDEPNRSYLPPRTTPAERATFARAFNDARQLEDADPGRAEARYRTLLDRQPGFAETHFRLARLLERRGAWDEAYGQYTRARDRDGHPQRCQTDFQDVYRAVAARHPQVVLVDGQAACRAASPHGLLGDQLFGDGMHPSLRGQIVLASAILERLHERRAFGWPERAPAPVIDPAACVRHFGVDRNCWSNACEFSALYYGILSGLRYDPSERRAKSARYKAAHARLVAGCDPDEAGVPSIGLRPSASEPTPAGRAAEKPSLTPRPPGEGGCAAAG